MKKPPYNATGDGSENEPAGQGSAAALMALISEELKKAVMQQNAASLVDWIEMGRVALDKFGDSSASMEFRLALEKSTGFFAGGPEDGNDPAAQLPLAYEEKFTPEAAASVMNSCILFCDVVITGDEAAIGLKYDEENMFIPMIVLLEREAAAEALVWAAENLGVPVIRNIMLSRNLAFYGKAGEGIPENSYREVLSVLARLGTGRIRPLRRSARKSRHGIPVKVPRPLAIELGDSLSALCSEAAADALLSEPLNAVRRDLRQLLGLPVAPFRVSRNGNLGHDEYRIIFKGLEAGRGKLDLRLCPGGMDAAAGAASKLIADHAKSIIMRRAPELLGRDEVDAILDSAEEKYPVVTGEVKSLLSLGIIREILQRLVGERVSIRNIAVILETLADWGSFGSGPGWMIIEQIRQALKRQICLQYADASLSLRALTVEARLESKIESLSPDPSVAQSACPPSDDWSELVSAAARGMKDRGFPPVVLCSPKARISLKEATRAKIPELAVLSYLEIPPDINVVPFGEIQEKPQKAPGKQGRR